MIRLIVLQSRTWSEKIQVVGTHLDPESSFLSGANSAHLPRTMPQEQPWETCFVSSVAGRIQISYEAFSKLVSSLFKFAVFFSLFSDTEEKNMVGIWGDIIIIRYPIFTMHRLSLQPRLQMQRTCHSLTTPKHKHIYSWRALAVPCHPCGCSRPCATMYQYLQYGHLHFILSASF